MPKINKLKEKVIHALEVDEQSRNSDIRLIQTIWYLHHKESLLQAPDGTYYVKVRDLATLPREDHASRIRRKVQEEAMVKLANGVASAARYLPTNPEVVKQRKMNEDVWRKFLGAGQKEMFNN